MQADAAKDKDMHSVVASKLGENFSRQWRYHEKEPGVALIAVSGSICVIVVESLHHCRGLLNKRSTCRTVRDHSKIIQYFDEFSIVVSITKF